MNCYYCNQRLGESRKRGFSPEGIQSFHKPCFAQFIKDDTSRVQFDGEWYYPQYWDANEKQWKYYEDGSGPIKWYEVRSEENEA